MKLSEQVELIDMGAPTYVVHVRACPDGLMEKLYERVVDDRYGKVRIGDDFIFRLLAGADRIVEAMEIIALY